MILDSDWVGEKTVNKRPALTAGNYSSAVASAQAQQPNVYRIDVLLPANHGTRSLTN
jgi:hypothetical protein